MSNTMLRIVATVMIVLIVAFSGCLGGDEKPAEVDPTPAAATPTTQAATPTTPAETSAEDIKGADAEGFTPKSSDRSPLEGYSGDCEGLDQNLLGRYDHDKNGLIDNNELEDATIGYEHNYEKQSDYEQVVYAHEHQCAVETK